MLIFVLTATYELRVSRKSHLRDHPIQYSLEYSMQRKRLGNIYVFFVIFSSLKKITEDFR